MLTGRRLPKQSPRSLADTRTILSTGPAKCHSLLSPLLHLPYTYTHTHTNMAQGWIFQTVVTHSWLSRLGCNSWSVGQEPLDTTLLPFREIGQQEDLLANIMLHVFTYCWFEMTWKYLTWTKFSYLTFILYCFGGIGQHLRFASLQ